MNKMWLAVLLVPYMGFAQTSQEGDFSEEAQAFDETLVSGVENHAEEPKSVACGKNRGAHEKEPAFCAYCGSSLIAQSKEPSAAMEDSSAQVASADQVKGSSVKRRASSTSGAKASARQSKMNEKSDRPRVTQRKKERSSQMEQQQAQVSSSQPSPSSEMSRRQQPALESKESGEQSAQVEKNTAPTSSSRPKVTQRNPLSSADQGVKKGRFSERNKEIVSLEKQRPCAQAHKKESVSKKESERQEKRGRAIARRSSHGSKPQIRESMSSRSSQED